MRAPSRSAGGRSPNAFPKSARLLHRRSFLAVKQAGTGFSDGPLAASWTSRPAVPTRAALPGAPAAVARVGLAVSSRVGNSVARNRIKRRLREAVRAELASLPPIDLVIVARASATRATVADFRGWLRRARARLRASVPGKGSSR